jgi:hypothetical protein
MNAGEDVNMKEIIANATIATSAAILSQHGRKKGRSL